MYNILNVMPDYYKAGIYIRLSEADEGKSYEFESESVLNQRNILMNFIKEKGFIFVDEYVDDGYSGTTFDRPGFQRLIEDIKAARALLANVPQFKAVADEKEREKQISKVLAKALDAHRKAQMRWDFIFSENSTGFHAPQEAQRVLGQSQEFARIGQIEVQSALKPFGLSVAPTIKAKMPKAPNPIMPNNILGAKPPVGLVQFDATYDFYKTPAK